jgi:ribonuclease HI
MKNKHEVLQEKFDYVIHADGGARGNPGEAAYGFVVYDSKGVRIFEKGERIGVATNNVAEYSGVIAALKWIEQNSKTSNLRIEFLLDSQLVAMQLSGKWKIKNENLRNLYFTIKNLEQSIGAKILYLNVPREQNQDADRLVNLALDN